MDGLEEEETENHVKKVAAEEDARGHSPGLRVGPNPEIVRIQEIGEDARGHGQGLGHIRRHL